MGQVVLPPPVKLILGLIVADATVVEVVRSRLEAAYGKIDLASPEIPFVATQYYEREMGSRLHKILWSFEALVPPEALATIKLTTNTVERTCAGQEAGIWRRRVNLDPGYVDLAKLVLATTKDRQHRLYLGHGIYGEVTLRFTGGRFEPWDWTYPDYRTPEYLTFFAAVRRRYRQQLAAVRGEPHRV
jgi:hypothetical protein